MRQNKDTSSPTKASDGGTTSVNQPSFETDKESQVVGEHLTNVNDATADEFVHDLADAQSHENETDSLVVEEKTSPKF